MGECFLYGVFYLVGIVVDIGGVGCGFGICFWKVDWFEYFYVNGNG